MIPSGYFDNDGKWVQTKFCFVSCGEECDCQPPFHLLPPSIYGLEIAKQIVSEVHNHPLTTEEIDKRIARLVLDTSTTKD